MAILELTDKKWKLFTRFFQKKHRGHPRKWSDRKVPEACTIHPSYQLPLVARPPHQTVYSRFTDWQKSGIICAIRDTILLIIKNKKTFLDVAHVEATFVRAVCGGDGIGCIKIGKGLKIMVIVDDQSRTCCISSF